MVMSGNDRFGSGRNGRLTPAEGCVVFVVFLVVLLVIFILFGIDPRGVEVGPLPWMAK